jgi:hypothetical protein
MPITAVLSFVPVPVMRRFRCATATQMIKRSDNLKLPALADKSR